MPLFGAVPPVESPVGSDGESGAICWALGAGGAINDWGFVGVVVEGALAPDDPKPVVPGLVSRGAVVVGEDRPPDERCASAGDMRRNVITNATRKVLHSVPSIEQGLD